MKTCSFLLSQETLHHKQPPNPTQSHSYEKHLLTKILVMINITFKSYGKFHLIDPSNAFGLCMGNNYDLPTSLEGKTNKSQLNILTMSNNYL